MEKTLGEKRVRTDFNVAGYEVVDDLKMDAARFINDIDQLENKDIPPESIGEFVRLKSLAMTAIEEGAMWAVKAATMGK